MKKKITALCLCVALLAVAVVGASLAYFTDTDNATNTFAVGNVKIDLIEQERKLDTDGNKTTELTDFDNGHKLYPIVGSAQGEKDALGMPTAKNYVDKMVTIQNTTAAPKLTFTAYAVQKDGIDDVATAWAKATA